MSFQQVQPFTQGVTGGGELRVMVPANCIERWLASFAAKSRADPGWLFAVSGI